MVVINVSPDVFRSSKDAGSLSTGRIITNVHNCPYNLDILKIGPTFSLEDEYKLVESMRG
jgi:hypothetical protein